MDEWQDRLRVAMFTNVYLPVTNGVVVSVESFRQALTRLGHHAYVMAPACGEIEDRAPYVFRYPALELPLQKYPLTLPVSPYVDQVLRNLKPQVLHANHPALLGRVAERKSEELDLPLVFTYHTRYADYSHYAHPLPEESVKEFIQTWLGEFMARCHHLVVPSQSIKNLLLETYELSGPISVVPTGVDLEHFAPRDRAEARAQLGWPLQPKVFLSVGRLAKEKNFELLLQAFARLQEPGARLVILGSGDEKSALEKLAHQLGLRERCQFAGSVAHKDLPTYLAAADVFAFASLTETQGLATLEALAVGLPVAAVDASGTRDIVSPDCSLLTPAEPAALARAMGEMAGRQGMASLARAQAARFGQLEQGRRLVEAYEQAIESHRHQQHVLQLSSESRSRWQTFLQFFRL
ncbi:MAG: glycosyltransferase [Candidatus Eremiobacteraeota bacterium]|nr:glycosyltransferase [Candidatus Eremiobacteraeota bacterium]MCW5869689.1 glycosyltransferase [Candidatus Eremiobacteraeota bacterium]